MMTPPSEEGQGEGGEGGGGDNQKESSSVLRVRGVKRKQSVSLVLGPVDTSEEDPALVELDMKVKRVKQMISSTVSSVPNDYNKAPSPSSLSLLQQNQKGSPSFSSSFTTVVGGMIPLSFLKLNERHTPLDVKAFLLRVESFDLRLWSRKPGRLCSFQCARYGWRLAGKNNLVCVSCRVLLSVPEDQGNRKLDEWTSEIEQQVQRTAHMAGCIWVHRPSPPDILKLPQGVEMQVYMKQAAKSLGSWMKCVPLFTSKYRVIMDLLDLTKFKEKTEFEFDEKLLKVPEIEGTPTSVIERIALFLMLNGWRMHETLVGMNNVLHCDLCLRDVPLLILRPPSSSSALHNGDIPHPRETDPVTNHWFWCPWKKALSQTQPQHQIKGKELLSLDPEVMKGLESYLSLAAKIDGDFRHGKLVEGALDMSDNDAAISLMRRAKSIIGGLELNGTIAAECVNQIQSDVTIGYENGIISVTAEKLLEYCQPPHQPSEVEKETIEGSLSIQLNGNVTGHNDLLTAEEDRMIVTDNDGGVRIEGDLKSASTEEDESASLDTEPHKSSEMEVDRDEEESASDDMIQDIIPVSIDNALENETLTNPKGEDEGEINPVHKAEEESTPTSQDEIESPPERFGIENKIASYESNNENEAIDKERDEDGINGSASDDKKEIEEDPTELSNPTDDIVQHQVADNESESQSQDLPIPILDENPSNSIPNNGDAEPDMNEIGTQEETIQPVIVDNANVASKVDPQAEVAEGNKDEEESNSNATSATAIAPLNDNEPKENKNEEQSHIQSSLVANSNNEDQTQPEKEQDEQNNTKANDERNKLDQRKDYNDDKGQYRSAPQVYDDEEEEDDVGEEDEDEIYGHDEKQEGAADEYPEEEEAGEEEFDDEEDMEEEDYEEEESDYEDGSPTSCSPFRVPPGSGPPTMNPEEYEDSSEEEEEDYEEEEEQEPQEDDDDDDIVCLD